MGTAALVNATEKSQAQPGTAERLVQAAYDVLVTRGLAGFKVLHVAAQAKANVALINYHFGGRDGLLDEVVRRTAAEVAQVRSERLDRLLATSSAHPPDARDVVQCWLGPWIENLNRSNNREVMLLMLHIMFAADVTRERKERLLENSVAVTSRFVDILVECFPDIPRSDMTWRMLCAVGSSYLVLGQHDPVGWSKIARGERRRSDGDATRELVAFILAGLSAPPAGGGSSGKPRRKRQSQAQVS